VRSYIIDLIRKYVCIVILASILLLTMTFLLSSAYIEKREISYAFVEEISIIETPKKGEQIEIRLLGFYYCPYKLHSHKVKINDYKREVNIKLWQIRVANTVCAAVSYSHPFNYPLYIKFPLSGNWIIFCNNKINISIKEGI